MGWFEAFRQNGGFARYSSNRSAVTVDKDFIAVLYVCVLVFLSSVLTAFGSRGKERQTTVIRVAYSVIVCSVILVCLYGHGWQEGEVTAETTYLFRSEEKFNATIGLGMNLISVNITLTGQYGSNNGEVNYNERLHWGNADELEAEFHSKLAQGLPAPLMTVAEYISVDCGGFRWGRYFGEAGYYSYILLWCSFAFWIVTIILMCSVVFFGSVMFIISGLIMSLTVLVYHLLQPSFPFMIPFGKQILRLNYSWCFWLLFSTGIITTILGFIILVFHYVKPKETAKFFGLENEFIEADDTVQHPSNSQANKAVERSFPSNGYHNRGYIDSRGLELSQGNSSSLPELTTDKSEANISSIATNDASSLSVSLDRNLVHQRFVCVSIPDDVGLYSDGDSYKLPIEGPGDSSSEIEGPGDSSSEIEGPGDSSGEIEGPGDSNVEIEGTSHFSGEIEGPSHSSDKIKGPSHSSDEIEGPSHSNVDIKEQLSEVHVQIVPATKNRESYPSTKF